MPNPFDRGRATPYTPANLSDHPSLHRPPQTEGLSDDALEEINRLWTIVRAFSNTAHDVNNALQVIAGSAELLESRELEPLVRRRVEAMRVESGKAAQSIDRLLSYARAPRQAAQRLDLSATVETAIALRLASLGRLRIALTFDRAGTPPVWVSGEAAKLLQAVLDLLLVAEDRLAGRPKARIALQVTVQEGFGVLRVETRADEGGQLESSEVPREADAATKEAQAWAAARIARAHGGDVEASGDQVTLRWPS